MVWFPIHRSARVSEILAISGLGIGDIKLAKNSWVFPGQSCRAFDTSPITFTARADILSADRVRCTIDLKYMIEPCRDDRESLIKYVRQMYLLPKLKDFVQRIIERKACELARTMTMKEILDDSTNLFEHKVSKKIHQEISKYGLRIFNAEIEASINNAFFLAGREAGHYATAAEIEEDYTVQNQYFLPGPQLHHEANPQMHIESNNHAESLNADIPYRANEVKAGRPGRRFEVLLHSAVE